MTLSLLVIGAVLGVVIVKTILWNLFEAISRF
jgi:hypothetical protein